MKKQEVIELCDRILDMTNLYKRNIEILNQRCIIGYVIKTSSGQTITSKKVNDSEFDDIEEYMIEDSPQPSIYDEETMYEILESVIINKNCEIEELYPMRWQDYFEEKITKLHETLKVIADNI